MLRSLKILGLAKEAVCGFGVILQSFFFLILSTAADSCLFNFMDKVRNTIRFYTKSVYVHCQPIM